MAKAEGTTEPKRSMTRRTGRLLGGLTRFIFGLGLIAAFVVTGVLIGGFAQFTTTVTEAAPPTEVPEAEAIVVLTGGSERIAEALDLLAKDDSRRLLISGVNPAVRAAELEQIHASHAALIGCCTDLESVSKDTINNAIETRKWMEQRGFSSLILVTSSYHMPRSRMEFLRQMPGITVHAWPVPLEGLTTDGWWREPDTVRLVVSEYVKYVGAWMRDFVRPDIFDSVRASMFGATQ